MKDTSIVRDVSLLMIGAGTVVIFSALLFVSSGEEAPPMIENVSESGLTGTLVNAEFRRLLGSTMVTVDMRIAIGEDLSGAAVEAIKGRGFLWSAQSDWSANQGIPPPGVVLVDEVLIDGNNGLVSLVVGERAASHACGISIDSSYIWDGHWEHWQSRIRMC
jgi:hypothetical protein